MKYIDGIKDDPISKSWLSKMFAEAEQSCMRLTIRPVKHIPIYEEINLSKPIWLDDIPKSATLTNKGGKKYLVYGSK